MNFVFMLVNDQSKLTPKKDIQKGFITQQDINVINAQTNMF